LVSSLDGIGLLRGDLKDLLATEDREKDLKGQLSGHAFSTAGA
jgi:hypothetical protein